MMDRITNYDKYMNQQMEDNMKIRYQLKKVSNRPNKIRLLPPLSKQQQILRKMSDLLFDNKTDMKENDYIEMMNHLKTLNENRK
jgi:hypothetical protein